MAAASAVPAAGAQAYTGGLELDGIPPEAKAGDTVVFSGRLGTASGYAVPGVTVYIRDDVRFGRDDIIGRATTGGDGRFYTTWTAHPRDGGTWDFYAEFRGTPDVSRAKSAGYGVRVSPPHPDPASPHPDPASPHGPPPGVPSQGPEHPASLVLYDIPEWAFGGDGVAFTGRLTSDGRPLGGAAIRIIGDGSDLGDRTLGYGTTDSGGWFSVTWGVDAGLAGTDIDVYAEFDGMPGYGGARSYGQDMGIHGPRPTRLVLHEIPERAYAGDGVTFTGRLTSEGRPLWGATVVMRGGGDPAVPDRMLGYAMTGQDGGFSVTWDTGAGPEGGSLDVYAEFVGAYGYEGARTHGQDMGVYKRGGTIQLEPPPAG